MTGPRRCPASRYRGEQPASWARARRSRGFARSAPVVFLRHAACMTEMIDLVYDRLIADEKLKDGTKYERLAAVVFRILTEQTTVHDLRLKGEVDVTHQIDVVIGDDKKRILIEAKDYDRKASLPVVRDFAVVVEDLEPDDAFVVSTVGFSANAQKWATAAR